MIINQLAEVAHFDTRANFLRGLEAPGRYPQNSCTFAKPSPSVIRHQRGDPVPVNCLEIHAPGIDLDLETATALLQEWMGAEELDYYRISMCDDNDPMGRICLIYYDVEDKKGKYRAKELGGRGQDLRAIFPAKREWDTALDRLHALASQQYTE
jgi:hypothetical protein